MGFAALAAEKHFASRVSLAVMLAPVAFVGRLTSPPFRLMSDLRADKVRRAGQPNGLQDDRVI